jgi:hypothetical protein
MEILENRDLIKDELGNYYYASSVYGKQITLVNAVVFNAFKRILDHQLVDEIKSSYDTPIAVGQIFTDMVKNKIDGLESGKYPGSIYSLEDVQKEYVVKVSGLYERSVVHVPENK